ncbi:FAD-binding domain-containing protein [Mycena sanguinolenta]|nr:FAD-binding domain-containing protein [Mycena sanguinolenta]
MTLSLLSLGLALLAGTVHAQAESDQAPFSTGGTASTDIWTALSARFGDRVLKDVAPFAQPCFANASSAECASVQELYQNEKARTAQATGYTWGQWETCQDTGDQCLLDYAVPTDPAATAGGPDSCARGSIPDYFIDVRGPDDVIAAFEFAKETGIPLVVKNTGHDFKGRSSGPNSLALWTHNLKDISYDPAFVAEGCTDAYPGVTAGAGVQFFEAFQFAEDNNITLVGGSDATVGLTGGFTMGGGHGVLSPVLGLGVDRVLQYKIVTPDGTYRTVNACQNEDLFFALRGGGGGTFGVVLEATILAAPAAPVQVVVVTWTAKSAPQTKALWSLIGEHIIDWADAGWGGYSMPELALFVTQRLTKDEAAKSMAPLLAHAEAMKEAGVEGAMAMVMEFPSFLPFFTSFMTDAGGNAGAGKVGYSVSLTSRLVPRASFATPDSRSVLVDALMAASAVPAPDAPLMIIQITAPTAARAADLAPGRTSVTPAWRDAVYHVTSMGMWNWNATKEEIMGVYDRTSRLMDNVRKVTPDAAYLNEADVYEPNHEVSFWGNHYPELATIKMKYDPDRLLDCWQCVGWNPDSERYICYL